jgi:hypothetical protein
VPPAAAAKLGRAKSVGKAVNQHIKTPGFAYEKVGRPHHHMHLPPPSRSSKIEHEAERMTKGIAQDQLLELLQTLAERIEKSGADHGHRCDNCGEVWRHDDSQLGDVAAHRCRSCGSEQWYKNASAVTSGIVATRRHIQKHAGVAKRQVTWQGLPMKIEHDAGDVRSGTSKDGVKWERPMIGAAYGYIPGTGGKGVDGEALDVYFAEEPVDGPVYQVDQVKKDTGELDEHKFMVGFPSEEEAKKAYLRHMPGWAFGSIKPIGKTFEDFTRFVEEKKS